tara:strand:+ start:1210 stop:1770 length:561 start_codon:yes stop_codon:yes gene_type:complete
MKTIEDYIYVANHIPVKFCKELIKECNKKKWEKHQWNSYVTGTTFSEKDKELDVLFSSQEQQNKIIPYLEKALEEYQIKNSWPGTDTHWLSRCSPVRFNKYRVGNIMRLHYDNIHSIFDGKLRGIPMVSIVGLLNENYTGAEFMLRDKEIKLKTGDILLFPSGIVYPHKIKEVKKGIRYSFVSWAF